MAVLAVVTAGCDGAPAPASRGDSSDGSQAHEECVLAIDGFTTTFDVPGTSGLVQPTVDLQPGDWVRLTAHGTVGNGSVLGPDHDPEGAPGDLAPTELPTPWPGPGLPKYALIGTWNRTAGNFLIGSDSQCVRSPTEGAGPPLLYVRVNDEDPENNNGSFQVVIRVFR